MQDFTVLPVGRDARPLQRTTLTPDEFDTLVAPLVPTLLRLAGRLTSWGQAEDVVQEALTRAWDKRSQFDAQRGALRSWLLAITADQARLERRRAKRRPEPDGGAASPATSSNAGSDVDLAALIAELSPRQRLAVNCYYFADLAISDVARVMNCSEGTVKSTLSDARAKLRSVLEAEQ